MKIALFPSIAFIVFLPKHSFSQIYIEPVAGYQKNLNNNRTYFLNTGLRAAFRFKKYELLVQVQNSWPQTLNYTVSSFTANPALPLNSPAEKKMRTSSYSFAIGNRFKVAGRKTKNSFFVSMYTGVMFQKTTVNYTYDKTNYILLNPDRTQSIAGPFFSAGFEYMRQIKSGRLFAELNFSTPPVGKQSYPSSFGPAAPASLNIGYSIKISKR
jgi:hypothetical protein